MKIKYIFWFSSLIVLFACAKDAEMDQKNYTYIKMNEPVENNSSGLTLSADIISEGKENTVVDYGFIYWHDNHNKHIVSLLGQGSMPDQTFSKRFSYQFSPEKRYQTQAYIVHPSTTVYSNEVQVSSNGGISPIIETIIPRKNFEQDSVEIHGKHFGSGESENEVSLNGVSAHVVFSSDTLVRFIVPSMVGCDSCLLELVSSGWRLASTKDISVYGPRISSVSTSEGKPGSVVSIKGSNLIHDNYETKVYFGSHEAKLLSLSSSELIVAVPMMFSTGLYNDLHVDYITVDLEYNSHKYFHPFTIINKSWEEFITPEIFIKGIPGAAVYDSKAYTLSLNNDLYQYDIINNTWENLSEFPGIGSGKSALVIYNNVLFKFGGYYSSFWTYDISSAQWEQKEGMPFTFNSATYIMRDDYLILITSSAEVWKYFFETNDFEKLNNFPGSIEGFVQLYEVGLEIIAATPEYSYTYNLNSDSWTPSYENFGVDYNNDYHSTGFVLDGIPYIVRGGTIIYQYHKNYDKWVMISGTPWPYAVTVPFFTYEKSVYFLANHDMLFDLSLCKFTN